MVFPGFSQDFRGVFPTFSSWLQDSELGYGLRRPSGYPIHDRRTSAPFRTEGAAAADGNYPQPWWPWMPWHFLVEVTQVFCWCILCLRGWKHQPDFTKLLQHVKHIETPWNTTILLRWISGVMIYFGISHDDEWVDLDGLSKVAKVRTLGDCGSSFLSTLWWNDSAAFFFNSPSMCQAMMLHHSTPLLHLGMDQYLLIPFLVGWTSIYQLFWCSPGVQGFDTLPFAFRLCSSYPANCVCFLDNVVYLPASRIETWMDSDGHLHESGWFKQHSKTQLLDG